MKTLILSSAMLFLVNNLLSQELKFDDLTRDANGRHQYKGDHIITSYISKNGTVYMIGDKIKIGMPSSNKTFAFITNVGNIGLMFAGVEPRQLEASEGNTETEIKTISIQGSRRTGFYATFQTKGMMGLIPSTYDIQIENALESGEIKSSVISSDDALTELKRCKDKLDLGLITQEKYDSIKKVLIKFIK